MLFRDAAWERSSKRRAAPSRRRGGLEKKNVCFGNLPHDASPHAKHGPAYLHAALCVGENVPSHLRRDLFPAKRVSVQPAKRSAALTKGACGKSCRLAAGRSHCAHLLVRTAYPATALAHRSAPPTRRRREPPPGRVADRTGPRPNIWRFSCSTFCGFLGRADRPPRGWFARCVCVPFLQSEKSAFVRLLLLTNVERDFEY